MSARRPHRTPPRRRSGGLLARVGGQRLALGVLATAAVFALSSLPGRGAPSLHGLDKAVHVTEYLLVGLAYLNVATAGFRRITARGVLLYFTVLVAVGAADELYQSLIPGRVTDWRDLAADATGGLLALGLGAALAWRLGTLGPGRGSPRDWWE